MRRLAAAAASLAVAAAPGPAWAGFAAELGVAPWREAVVSVESFAEATVVLRQAGGWRRTHSGRIDRSELTLWQLPATASGRFERWCAPAAETGCLRFVRFAGVAQRPVRLAARAWDTGGIYSIMVRSDNVPALFDAAIKAGWWAESEPVRFNFGASDLRNVVLSGPHGFNIAVYERVSPPFAAFPVGRVSQAFNAMRMVRSRPAARAFYERQLGFGVVFDSNSEPAEPARSNFGIPLNYTPQVKRGAAALQPVDGETGRVEVMQIEGFTGSDHSADASPPNLGILTVRYPVRQLAAYRAATERQGAVIAYRGEGVSIPGLGLGAGKFSLFAVRDPDGNLTEFYGKD